MPELTRDCNLKGTIGCVQLYRFIKSTPDAPFRSYAYGVMPISGQVAIVYKAKEGLEKKCLVRFDNDSKDSSLPRSHLIRHVNLCDKDKYYNLFRQRNFMPLSPENYVLYARWMKNTEEIPSYEEILGHFSPGNVGVIWYVQGSECYEIDFHKTKERNDKDLIDRAITLMTQPQSSHRFILVSLSSELNLPEIRSKIEERGKIPILMKPFKKF